MTAHQFPRIEAKPQFLALKKETVHAALQRGKACPISLEVGRLLVEYLDVLKNQKLGKDTVTKDDLLKVTPDCCRPIEAIALKYAIELTGEKGLLTVLGPMLPGHHSESSKIH